VECFAHPSASAAGVCKSCGKAICRTCAQDLGFAVVCSEACEKEAAELNTMNQRSKRLVGVGSKSNVMAGGVVTYGLFSAFFLVWAGVTYFRTGQIEFSSVGLGLLFAFIALFAHRRAKQFSLQC
jgi:uncharacterized membrane protein